MSIASDNAVRELAERVDGLAQTVKTYEGLLETVLTTQKECERLNGEIKALKARMGKKPQE